MKISPRLTPKLMIMMNNLKKTRNMKLLANAMGMMPKKVVAAPTMIDGPISPSALAIRASFGMAGLCFFGGFCNTGHVQILDTIRVGASRKENVRSFLTYAGTGKCWTLCEVGQTVLPV